MKTVQFLNRPIRLIVIVAATFVCGCDRIQDRADYCQAVEAVPGDAYLYDRAILQVVESGYVTIPAEHTEKDIVQAYRIENAACCQKAVTLNDPDDYKAHWPNSISGGVLVPSVAHRVSLTQKGFEKSHTFLLDECGRVIWAEFADGETIQLLRLFDR